VQTKAILYQNLWNSAILYAVFFCVRIALRKFTQTLSYVVSIQVRRHVHKQTTKTRYAVENPRRSVFGTPVLFSLGLGLTTPYDLGILVWNFYQTLVIVSIELWMRSEPQIRPTGFTIIFFSSPTWLKGRFVCVWNCYIFIPRWVLIRLTWTLSRFFPN